MMPQPRKAIRRCSLAHLKRTASEQCTQAWRKEISVRNAGKRVFRIPTANAKPSIRPALRKVTKGVASRFFQLLSGHSMSAPFLKDRWGWSDTDECWWCNKNRQSREYLFKECTRWKKEIKELWKEVGEASGKRGGHATDFKSRKGFGYRVKEAKARPSNTPIRELLSDDRYTEAVLAFLKATKVGEVKAGVIKFFCI